MSIKILIVSVFFAVLDLIALADHILSRVLKSCKPCTIGMHFHITCTCHILNLCIWADCS
uniref:Uncharacterized protein n=1 Tax=Rhizophora mucronata TaxID=61149 RepID=A0A2P2QIP4_RHIMU